MRWECTAKLLPYPRRCSPPPPVVTGWRRRVFFIGAQRQRGSGMLRRAVPRLNEVESSQTASFFPGSMTETESELAHAHKNTACLFALPTICAGVHAGWNLSNLGTVLRSISIPIHRWECFAGPPPHVSADGFFGGLPPGRMRAAKVGDVTRCFYRGKAPHHTGPLRRESPL